MLPLRRALAFFLLCIPLFTTLLYAEEEENLYLTQAELSLAQMLLSFDWQEAGTYTLPQSNAQLDIPKGYMLIGGNDAFRFCEHINLDVKENVEAVVVREDFESFVFLLWSDQGQVSIDDWKAVDADLLLTSIKEHVGKNNTDQPNAVHVVEWMQRPKLDPATHTVTFAVELSSVGDEFGVITSYGLSLGRSGYIGMSWISDKEHYDPNQNAIAMLMDKLSFAPGERYTDFSKGDKVANDSIAAVITSVAGGKLLQSSGLLFALKKFWGAILGSLGVAGYFLKRWWKK